MLLVDQTGEAMRGNRHILPPRHQCCWICHFAVHRYRLNLNAARRMCSTYGRAWLAVGWSIVDVIKQHPINFDGDTQAANSNFDDTVLEETESKPYREPWLPDHGLLTVERTVQAAFS